MEMTTLIGLTAAFCTTSAFVPQVVQILRTGNVDGISLQMYSIFTIGVALWFGYGIIVQDLPMLLANLITLVLALMVLGLTIHKRRQARIARQREATAAAQSAQLQPSLHLVKAA